MTPPRRLLVLRTPRQIAALRPLVRHEILDQLAAREPQSIAELARGLDRRPNALTYHVRALCAVGVLVPAGRRPTGGRREAVYRRSSRRLAIATDSNAPASSRAALQTATSALRLAARELRSAVATGWPGPVGAPVNPGRRMTARLRRADERAVRRKLAEVEALITQRRAATAGRRWAFTFLFVPLTPKRGRTT